MWQFPPGTSLLQILALGILWRVSSVDKGVTPAVGTKVPLRALPAPLWQKQYTNKTHVTLHNQLTLLAGIV